MGNVGNIEKVMVAGILVIIIIILGIAIWGNNSPPPYDGSEGTAKAQDTDKGLKLGAEVPAVEVPGNRNNTVNEGPTPYHVPPTDSDLANESGSQPENVTANRTNNVPVEPPPARPSTYTVASGDTFEGIAVKVLGSASYTDELMKANEDIDPRKMRVGQTLNIPQVDGVSGSASPAEVITPQRTTEPVTLPASDSYKVEEGDTLFAISKKVFGSSRRWREIWDLNRTKCPECTDLRPGMVLSLPQN